MERDVVIVGDPVLREKAQPVTVFDASVGQLVDDLLQTMCAHKGLGLAAEQIGSTAAVCVIDAEGCIRGDEGAELPLGIPHPLVLVNPAIRELEGTQIGQEGCLSFPDVYVTIKRGDRVTVDYQDVTGASQSLVATGLLSRAIQHEIDHLRGVLFTDRMTPAQKVATAGKVKRLKKRGRAGIRAKADVTV